MYTYVNILYSVNKELNWIELNWIELTGWTNKEFYFTIFYLANFLGLRETDKKSVTEAL